jgi:serine/threonine-protein kinase RsbW
VRVKVDILAGPASLDHVQAALDSFWSDHAEVPSGVRMEVGIAATEIAANIVEHGCAAALHMEIAVRRNEVRVEFTDSGNPAEIDLLTVRRTSATNPATTGVW